MLGEQLVRCTLLPDGRNSPGPGQGKAGKAPALSSPGSGPGQKPPSVFPQLRSTVPMYPASWKRNRIAGIW